MFSCGDVLSGDKVVVDAINNGLTQLIEAESGLSSVVMPSVSVFKFGSLLNCGPKTFHEPCTSASFGHSSHQLVVWAL